MYHTPSGTTHPSKLCVCALATDTSECSNVVLWAGALLLALQPLHPPPHRTGLASHISPELVQLDLGGLVAENL